MDGRPMYEMLNISVEEKQAWLALIEFLKYTGDIYDILDKLIIKSTGTIVGEYSLSEKVTGRKIKVPTRIDFTYELPMTLAKDNKGNCDVNKKNTKHFSYVCDFHYSDFNSIIVEKPNISFKSIMQIKDCFIRSFDLWDNIVESDKQINYFFEYCMTPGLFEFLCDVYCLDMDYLYQNSEDIFLSYQEINLKQKIEFWQKELKKIDEKRNYLNNILDGLNASLQQNELTKKIQNK